MNPFLQFWIFTESNHSIYFLSENLLNVNKTHSAGNLQAETFLHKDTENLSIFRVKFFLLFCKNHAQTLQETKDT